MEYIDTVEFAGKTYRTRMVYVKGFNGSELGQASALSVMLLLIILIITVIQMTVSNKLDDWER